MDILRIKGKATFQELGTGFWGITQTNGKQWMPINFPEQLKLEGAAVVCEIKTNIDYMGMQMWGTPVKILSFQTLLQV